MDYSRAEIMAHYPFIAIVRVVIMNAFSLAKRKRGWAGKVFISELLLTFLPFAPK